MTAIPTFCSQPATNLKHETRRTLEESLAVIIRSAWLRCGYKIAVWVPEKNEAGNSIGRVWSIRSELVNGLPPKRKGVR